MEEKLNVKLSANGETDSHVEKMAVEMVTTMGTAICKLRGGEWR